MHLADPVREVGLHGRELLPAADDGPGVQLAALVEGNVGIGRVAFPETLLNHEGALNAALRADMCRVGIGYCHAMT